MKHVTSSRKLLRLLKPSMVYTLAAEPSPVAMFKSVRDAKPPVNDTSTSQAIQTTKYKYLVLCRSCRNRWLSRRRALSCQGGSLLATYRLLDQGRFPGRLPELPCRFSAVDVHRRSKRAFLSRVSNRKPRFVHLVAGREKASTSTSSECI